MLGDYCGKFSFLYFWSPVYWSKLTNALLLFLQDLTNGEILLAEETVTPQRAAISQKSKSPLEATSEEEEPEQDIEMPPPMEIQEHSFKPDAKEISTDDVSAKLVCLSIDFLVNDTIWE